MSQSQWESISKVTTVVWAVIGPLIGVLIGAYIANRNQRKHWIADNKKEEFRELLKTLSASFRIIVNFHSPMVGYGPDEQRANHEAEQNALIVLNDRLFIADEVKRIDLEKRWTDAVNELNHGGHSGAFGRAAVGMFDDIIKAAKHIID